MLDKLTPTVSGTAFSAYATRHDGDIESRCRTARFSSSGMAGLDSQGASLNILPDARVHASPQLPSLTIERFAHSHF
jgi:hypothetical protein